MSFKLFPIIQGRNGLLLSNTQQVANNEQDYIANRISSRDPTNCIRTQTTTAGRF